MPKVALRKVTAYDEALIRKELIKAIDDLGGLGKFISPGDKVMLKLNLLMKKKPEEATTTHPTFVEALVNILHDFGAVVILADSPGGPFNPGRLKGIYDAGGYQAVSDRTGAILNYDVSESKRECEPAKFLKTQTVMHALDTVDHVISVSKLKTHGMMKFTGAVKNQFGIVPGVLKAEYHFTMPKTEDFADALIDICMCANPVLSFMDGIVGMEGDGPSAGTPVDIGAVIVSESPYHLDVVATQIIGIDPMSVPTIEQSVKRQLIRSDFSDIVLVGERVESLKMDSFEVPEIRNVGFLEAVPTWLRKPVDQLLKTKPVFDHDTCIACGECASSCPPKVIEMKDRLPYVHLEGCIRCFCCQELCPAKAVDIHRSWLMKRLLKL